MAVAYEKIGLVTSRCAELLSGLDTTPDESLTRLSRDEGFTLVLLLEKLNGNAQDGCDS